MHDGPQDFCCAKYRDHRPTAKFIDLNYCPWCGKELSIPCVEPDRCIECRAPICLAEQGFCDCLNNGRSTVPTILGARACSKSCAARIESSTLHKSILIKGYNLGLQQIAAVVHTQKLESLHQSKLAASDLCKVLLHAINQRLQPEI